MPDDTQPDAGQGGEEAGGSPYDSFLQTVPEQAREAAEQWFRDTSKGLDAKLQEAAELKKTLGPYQEVQALSAYQPEQLSELLAWHQQVTGSPEAFQEWLADAAKEAGLTPKEEQQLADAEETGELSQKRIEEIVQERIAAQVAPLEEWRQGQEKEREISAVEGTILAGFSRIEKESGRTLDDEQRQIVLKLGMDEPGDDWLDIGFDRYNKMVSQAQKSFVDEKAGGPGSPISAGGSEAFKATRDYKEAGEQARNIFRSSQAG